MRKPGKVVPIHRELVKIDKDVPVPHKHPAQKHNYPFATMEIGDSFICNPESIIQFRGAVAHAQLKHHRKFTTRKRPEGIRCWRIE